MSILGLFTGDSTLLVGVEDGLDGTVKAYVGHRCEGFYALVNGEDADQLRRAWANPMGHIIIPTPPPEALHWEPTPWHGRALVEFMAQTPLDRDSTP